MRVAILVALCVAVGALPTGKCVTGALEPWWCRVHVSEDNLEKLVESTLEEMMQVQRFATSLLNKDQKTCGLKDDCSSSDSDNVYIPPSPVAKYNDIGSVADAFWNLSVLHFAYQSVLGQQLWNYSTTELAHLEMFGILLHHTYVATERILRAGQCSCGCENCTLEYPSTEDWNSVTCVDCPICRSCTLECYLDSIIERVKQTVVAMQGPIIRWYLNDNDPGGAAWYMCAIRDTVLHNSSATQNSCAA